MPLEVIDTLMEISLVAEMKMISPSEIIMTLGGRLDVHLQAS